MKCAWNVFHFPDACHASASTDSLELSGSEKIRQQEMSQHHEHGDKTSRIIAGYLLELDANPNDPKLLGGLGGAYTVAKEYQKAEEVLKNAVELTKQGIIPLELDVFNNLAYLYRVSGRSHLVAAVQEQYVKLEAQAGKDLLQIAQ